MKDIHEVLRQKQAQYAQIGKQVELLQQARETSRGRAVAAITTLRTTAPCSPKWTRETPMRWLPTPALILRMPPPNGTQFDSALAVESGRKGRGRGSRLHAIADTIGFQGRPYGGNAGQVWRSSALPSSAQTPSTSP